MKRINFPKRNAQTAIELAAFGSILIFILGVTVRAAVQNGQQQDAIYSGSRLAMLMSYDYSQRRKGKWPDDHRNINGNTSRNSATVFLVEDRLSAGTNRYGSIERVVKVATGVATHSRELFQEIVWGETMNLPVIDLYVNGVHFPFLTADMREVCVSDAAGVAAGDCAVPGMVFPDISRSTLIECGETKQYVPSKCPTKPTFREASTCVESLCDGSPGSSASNWHPECCEDEFYGQGTARSRKLEWSLGCIATAAFCTSATDPGHCWPPQPDGITITPAFCPALYKPILNQPSVEEWCNHDGPPSDESCENDPLKEKFNLIADERFDLLRDFEIGMPNPDVPVVQTAEKPGRADFSWQWYRVWAFDEEVEQGGYEIVGFVPGGRGGGSGFTNGFYLFRLLPETKLNHGEGMNADDIKNLHLDVDGDMKIERVLDIVSHSTGIAKYLKVIDFQDGDFDGTAKPTDFVPRPSPGFTNDISMMSVTKDGTIMMIEEGKLYSIAALGTPADRQFIRTARKKDHVDVISRVFLLNRHTGRFCAGNIGVDPGFDQTYLNPINVWPVKIPPNNEDNPVEVCCDTTGCVGKAGGGKKTAPGENTCFGENTFSTCLFVGDITASFPALPGQKSKYPVLYIRSRLETLVGRKYITEVSDDPNFNFELGQ